MNDHFVKRWNERGDGSIDGMTLGRAIQWAIQNEREDLVERMFHLNSDRYLWRFRSVGGAYFFAVIRDTVPLTVLTRDMMKYIKQGRRR